MSCWLGLTDDPQLSNSRPLRARSRQSSFLKTTVKGVTSACKKLWIAFWPFIGVWWLAFSSVVQINCLWEESGKDNINATWSEEEYNEPPQHTTGLETTDPMVSWRWSHCHQPHKVQKALAYALIIGLYKLAPGILIIRWCYQINLRDLLKGKINQDVVYDKRYLLALYVILWASSILINFSIKCASCEQFFTLRWTISYFSHHQYVVPHAICAFVSLPFYAIIYFPSFFCCWHVIDLTNALVSLAADTKNLADSVAINNDDEPDRILSKVFDRIKEQSWSRHAGIGKEVEFFTKLTMFVGAIVGFAFSNIYVSSKLSNFMEWAHHVSQLLYLAVACMTPFFYVASGVKKLHEAHEIFVCQARRAQVEKLCKSSTNAAVPLEWEKWSVIIDTMRERVVSIVNTEKEQCWTAFATMGAILWHLLGHLNKFDDAPKGIIETERFALTYMISFTLILVILTVLAVIFGFDMVPQFVKAGNRQGHLRVILCSFPVGGVALAVVYLPWHYLKYITCKL
ncbi:PREDICTED: uncharacterized protein LOC109464399 [Branchiostoma belcheri]|uniref:Uncharacterized protein LOC109464399 n=1 Tax=Branchiostoma belcheri TaxID=7741 RepID=A0A6P4XXS7_BRABE|nr:PREDICTED: uncharacterized protein LOC109464399 [Branchiostoma belcheri]